MTSEALYNVQFSVVNDDNGDEFFFSGYGGCFENARSMQHALALHAIEAILVNKCEQCYDDDELIDSADDVDPYAGTSEEETDEEIAARQEAELDRAEQEAYEQAGYADVMDELIDREESEL